MMSSPDAV
ncbi:hypothetical protein D047_5044, partial [Vibrio parahaemolyticus VPTS-2010_2]